MALYSFSVRDKKTGEYIRDDKRFDLAFLDYFAMQFNDEKELMKFLGIDLDKYDNIVIEYSNNHERKFLPILFDAPKLEEIVRGMVSFPQSYSSVYENIATGYKYPGMVEISEKVPNINATSKLLIFTRILDRDNEAVADKLNKNGYLHDKAVEFAKKGYSSVLTDEMTSSYMKMRKLYMGLRELGFISGGCSKKPICNTTMEEVLNKLATEGKTIDEITGSLKLTPYEELLISRVLNESDEEAYKELKSCSLERLRYLEPVFRYIDSERRKNR